MIDAKMTRRAFLGLAATASLAACGGGGGSSESTGEGASEGTASGTTKIVMITDVGGVHDQSFNQLSWAGLERLSDEFGWEVSYIESKQEADYITNLDKAVDDEPSLVWGIGFAMADAINQVADQNPDVKFAAIECTNDLGVSNLTGVNFKSEESSFVVGYIAARMSKSGQVGFVGGVDSEIIQSASSVVSTPRSSSRSRTATSPVSSTPTRSRAPASPMRARWQSPSPMPPRASRSPRR